MAAKTRRWVKSRQDRAACIRILIAKVGSMASDSAPPDFSPKNWVKGWLKAPHPALGNHTPGSLLDTDDGRRRVVGLLGQVEAGSYA